MRFATELLGLQSRGRGDDESLRLRMDEYDHRVIVHPTGRDDVDYVGWEVSDEQTLDLMTNQLKAAGARVTSGTPAIAASPSGGYPTPPASRRTGPLSGGLMNRSQSEKQKERKGEETTVGHRHFHGSHRRLVKRP
jgi:hypothetical protein